MQVDLEDREAAVTLRLLTTVTAVELVWAQGTVNVLDVPAMH